LEDVDARLLDERLRVTRLFGSRIPRIGDDPKEDELVAEVAVLLLLLLLLLVGWILITPAANELLTGMTIAAVVFVLLFEGVDEDCWCWCWCWC